MEGILSKITFSEFQPATTIDGEQSKKIKLQNSSYKNITEKYRKEKNNSEDTSMNDLENFNYEEKKENYEFNTAKEEIKLKNLKGRIELVRYFINYPVEGTEYRPIKISSSMEENIINNYLKNKNDENKTIEENNHKINSSDTNVILKAGKKYMDDDYTSQVEKEDLNDVVIAPERDIDNYTDESKNINYYDNIEIPLPTPRENISQNIKDKEEKDDYVKLIEKLKQERDAAAERAKVASDNYNETRSKLAQAADQYVSILKEQTASLNHEAENSEQKNSDCQEQLNSMLAEIDKVNL